MSPICCVERSPKSPFLITLIRFVQTSAIDFTEVAVHYPGRPLLAGTIFTVSSCGRFLMVANGCLVYLYEMNRLQEVTSKGSNVSSGALCPVTSIICPHRVLACSMDTSSNRYAIAILLDGRVGLVCDINTSLASSPAAATCQRDSNGISMNTPDLEASSESRNHGTSSLDRVSLKTSASASDSNYQVREVF